MYIALILMKNFFLSDFQFIFRSPSFLEFFKYLTQYDRVSLYGASDQEQESQQREIVRWKNTKRA